MSTEEARPQILVDEHIIEDLRMLVVSLYEDASMANRERGKLENTKDRQVRASFLSGREFAYGNAAHELHKILRYIGRGAPAEFEGEQA